MDQKQVGQAIGISAQAVEQTELRAIAKIIDAFRAEAEERRGWA